MRNQKLDCILLVDDDAITNEINKHYIDSSGVTNNIELATDGQFALNYFMKEEVISTPPDLVLLDINMPRMNGWEFVEEYQKLGYNNTTIVMLTSSINEGDLKKAEDSNVVSELITKPLDESKIDKIMDKYFYNL